MRSDWSLTRKELKNSTPLSVDELALMVEIIRGLDPNKYIDPEVKALIYKFHTLPKDEATFQLV
mgnify:CR=1 FL=1